MTKQKAFTNSMAVLNWILTYYEDDLVTWTKWPTHYSVDFHVEKLTNKEVLSVLTKTRCVILPETIVEHSKHGECIVLRFNWYYED